MGNDHINNDMLGGYVDLNKSSLSDTETYTTLEQSTCPVSWSKIREGTQLLRVDPHKTRTKKFKC